MTEKRFEQSEIIKIVNDVYSNYLRHYSQGKMECRDLILIEHFILTLERELDNYCRDLE